MLVRTLVIVALVLHGAGLWTVQPCPDDLWCAGAPMPPVVVCALHQRPNCCMEICAECPLCDAAPARPCPVGRPPEAPAIGAERAMFFAILTAPPVVIGEMTRPEGPPSRRPDTRSAVRAPARAALCVWVT